MMMESLGNQLLLGLGLAALIMLVLWLVERTTHNAGVVDVGWSAGVGLLALLFAVTTDTVLWRRLLAGGMLGVWSLRLAGYLLVNRVLGHNEDGRYRTLRQRWGALAGFYFLLFFEAQALLVLIFALPALAVLRNASSDFGPAAVASLLVWSVAFGGELLADWQLARFRANPAHRGQTCRAGLWRYSRHPNYFFEWLHWWAYVPLAIGSTLWWTALIPPPLMLFFLFKVTGIPATEAQAVASRGDDYRQYQRTTNAFVPWFPRADHPLEEAQ
jgi:steroid 5-alpha reductase family enzyme